MSIDPDVRNSMTVLGHWTAASEGPSLTSVRRFATVQNNGSIGLWGRLDHELTLDAVDCLKVAISLRMHSAGTPRRNYLT